MGLVTIIAPPAKTRWATPEQVLARLGLESTTGNLALLGDLIDEQSGTAESIVSRPICRTRYLERVPGRGARFLRLSRGPIETVHSITLRGEPVDPSDYYVADPRRAIIARVADSGFPGGLWELTADMVGRSERVPLGGDPRPDYAIDYTGGYVMPEDEQTLATPPNPGIALPFELRAVVQAMVREEFYGRQRDPGAHIMKKADRSLTFFKSGEELRIPGNGLTVLQAEQDRILA